MFKIIKKWLTTNELVERVSMCDKPDCLFYSEWEVNKKWNEVFKLPEKWRTKNNKPYAYPFCSCLLCKHFKRIDLYYQDKSSN